MCNAGGKFANGLDIRGISSSMGSINAQVEDQDVYRDSAHIFSNGGCLRYLTPTLGTPQALHQMMRNSTRHKQVPNALVLKAVGIVLVADRSRMVRSCDRAGQGSLRGRLILHRAHRALYARRTKKQHQQLNPCILPPEQNIFLSSKLTPFHAYHYHSYRQRLAGMPSTIVLALVGAIGVYMLFYGLLRITQDKREPPAVCTTIPFLGPILEMANGGPGFWNNMR